MELDKEQQARLTFLTEAETYFEDIETVLLSLQTTEDRPQQLNIAMRAAHSVKGTAGMMNFLPLSQVANQMEESFKLLQARQITVDAALSTLLLQGVDCLRAVRLRHYHQEPVDTAWLAIHVDPVFDDLHQRLGTLTDEDEARLLADESDADLDVMIFTTTVDDCLAEFEQKLPQLNNEDLRKAVLAMANSLSEVGLMTQLESFVALCDSVQVQCTAAPPEAVRQIARQALSAWQRSQSLVLLNRTDNLPTQLDPVQANSFSDRPADSYLKITPKQAAQSDTLPADLAVSLDELSQLQAQFEALEIDLASTNQARADLASTDLASTDLASTDLASTDLAADLASTIETTKETLTTDDVLTVSNDLVSNDLASNDLVSNDLVTGLAALIDSGLSTSSQVSSKTMPARPQEQTEQPATVRVRVDQLRQINSLFESLILNRNAINLQLRRLQSFSNLMQERMTSLASFNRALQQWYDQASSEGRLPERFSTPEPIANRPFPAALTPQPLPVAPPALDTLELDRYSKLHLLAQENMETIVQLDEVSRDIDLGLGEIGQAIGELNYTSQSLKSRISQAQMRSFKEIVGRFPRVIRDWSVRYDKPVELKIEGENTLLEQFTLAQVSDPLIHLLRNAFDHGIEKPEIRRTQQKSEVGTITIRALNRGNQAVISVSDDGAGIDLNQVRDRISQYDIPQTQINGMDRPELLAFLFEPGFSTKGEVTELSGRGVGMDVVVNNLKPIQGDVQVTTEPGQGTTFTLTIPLSSSILRVMVVERDGTILALPIDTVQEMITTPPTDLSVQMIPWQERDIPLVRLENYWAVQYAARPIEMSGTPLINQTMVVVVGEGDHSYGLAIDRFWQEQEVAIRPIASPIPLPPGFSGATVLGDGRVVPLIDPVNLREWIVQQPKEITPDRPDSMASQPQTDVARVLVVDDSIHARRYLAISLEREGYVVEQAKDGREAMDKLNRGLTVNAIICDIEMPRLDGYGVLEELRDQPNFRQLPIVMLTSRSGTKHRKLAMNLGATAYFSKPYNEQGLLQTLRQLTQNES